LLFQHKPTIRSLLLHILYNKFIKNERAKLPVYREDAKFIDPDVMVGSLETKYIALVLNEEVKELIRLRTYAADILLSKETKLIEFDPKEVQVKKGMLYKKNKFIDGDLDEKN